MRLWSIHPKYLDCKGLVALWREGLLAKKVLEGKTKGYKNHPQLNRFKATSNSETKINIYLHFVCDEADRRGYCFDRAKLQKRKNLRTKMLVTSDQIKFEWTHLLKKQALRSRVDFLKNRSLKRLHPHPLFRSIKGEIADWEVVGRN